MKVRKTAPFPAIPGSDITPRELALGRRRLLQLAGGSVAALAAPRLFAAPAALAATPNPAFLAPETQTRFADATSYNNFYEFGTDKSDPAKLAGSLKTRPWTVLVDGEVLKPRTFDIDALLKLAPMEERVYRHRCVEGWSMVIPWIGFPLAKLLQQVQPNGHARYIETTTLYDPDQMPGQRDPVLQWPYIEGLRLDEAMHPLALLTFGMYGQLLPNQNGAPLRLVLPWKYGFKGAKSLVRIRLVREQPLTSWMRAVPQWYGFYSNVNPQVSPQNWSQASERVIGAGLFGGHHPTRLFNGYADQVAGLYRGMDLNRFF